MQVNGVQFYLGMYDTEEEAALAYEQKFKESSHHRSGGEHNHREGRGVRLFLLISYHMNIIKTCCSTCSFPMSLTTASLISRRKMRFAPAAAVAQPLFQPVLWKDIEEKKLIKIQAVHSSRPRALRIMTTRTSI